MNDSKALYFRLLGHVRPHWKGFALAVGATALAAATEPLFPALLKPLLDKGFAAREEAWLVWVPAAIVGIFTLRGILGYLASYAMSWVSNRLIADLRHLMFARLVRLPATYFDRHSSSVPVTKIAHDVGGVAGSATSVLTSLVRDSLSILGLLAWLLYLNWKLTLVSLAIMPLTGLLIRAFTKRLRQYSLASQEGMTRLNEVLHESIRGQRVIKVSLGEAQIASRFSHVNNALRGYSMRQAIAAAAAVPTTQILASVCLAIVVQIAIQQSANNEATVGDFVSFITAMLLLLAPIKHLAEINAPLQRGLAAAESIFQLIDEPSEKDEGVIELGRAHGEIRFEKIHLRYEHAERDALSDISLIIRPGETIAIVGPSGGGKSSLVNLVPRFYTPTSGRILLDGNDLTNIRLDSLRANIAYVGQDVFLFDDTVAANIAFGATKPVPFDLIEKAARIANATEFINQLPNRFDTPLGENGNRLSGGQRQRIAIARAILKDAPILLLDEATSALDSESEQLVQAALEQLMHNRTTLVIAHRLSTIERADRILVLAHAHIAEVGSHAELMARDGIYASLRRLQFSDSV